MALMLTLILGSVFTVSAVKAQEELQAYECEAFMDKAGAKNPPRKVP